MAGKEVYLHETFYTKTSCLKEDGVRQDSFGDIIRKENVLKSRSLDPQGLVICENEGT